MPTTSNDIRLVTIPMTWSFRSTKTLPIFRSPMTLAASMTVVPTWTVTNDLLIS
ncbi:MAG: hypothetical protein U0231_16265 [Nitrospiraceae bacterium]